MRLPSAVIPSIHANTTTWMVHTTGKSLIVFPFLSVSFRFFPFLSASGFLGRLQAFGKSIPLTEGPAKHFQIATAARLRSAPVRPCVQMANKSIAIILFIITSVFGARCHSKSELCLVSMHRANGISILTKLGWWFVD